MVLYLTQYHTKLNFRKQNYLKWFHRLIFYNLKDVSRSYLKPWIDSKNNGL